MSLSRRKLSKVALAALVSSSSCAVWAARAPSPQRNCQNDTSAGAVDLMIATTTATVLRATNTFDSQPVWALLPAALLLSGGLGVFYAQRCQDREADPAPVPPSADSMPDAAPDVGANPLSDAALPGAADGSTTTPVDAPSASDQHATAPDAPPGVTPGLPPLPCSISPTVLCPEHFSCALIDGNRGTCLADN